jgi:UTP-glucose-1-phosphate uridylyltransferase
MAAKAAADGKIPIIGALQEISDKLSNRYSIVDERIQNLVLYNASFINLSRMEGSGDAGAVIIKAKLICFSDKQHDIEPGIHDLGKSVKISEIQYRLIKEYGICNGVMAENTLSDPTIFLEHPAKQDDYCVKANPTIGSFILIPFFFGLLISVLVIVKEGILFYRDGKNYFKK